MKYIKRWVYLILLVVSGVVYLSMVDGWQVYAKPLAELKSIAGRMIYGQPALSETVIVQTPSPSPEPEYEPEPEQKAGEGDSPDTGDPAGEDMSETVSGGDAAQSEQAVFGDGGEPAYMTVEDDYFADALFIGDSRSVGLFEYGGLEDISTFYVSKGLTVYKLFDAQIVEAPGQKQKLTVEQGLEENDFKKIYLMIGINEMGTGTVDTFVEKYKEVVDRLLEMQPDAILYIQAILKVTTERSGQGDYINNEGITARNEALLLLADNVRIFYLDANPLLCDETGGLEPNYTGDGVHLKARYIEIWKDYLKTHAVNLDVF